MINNEYVAHIIKLNQTEHIQTASEHCRAAAQYAGESLSSVNLSNIGYLTGLLHDMGKFCDKFLNYIQRAANGENVVKGSVIHTFTGAVYILQRFHNEERSPSHNLTAEIIAWAIGSHHGEFDCIDLENKSGFEHRVNYDKKQICYDEAVGNFYAECADSDEIDKLFSLAAEEISVFCNKVKGDIQKFKGEKGSSKSIRNMLFGMISRLVLSAVIEGDRRDTQEFMEQRKLEYADADKQLWEKQLEFFETKLSSMTGDSDINKARKYISEQSADFAEKSGGIFRISVPTGGGKTLATLRYALTHAAKHDKKRIVFIIPLLSVLDQNAKVISDFVADSEKIVTEHHSNIIKYNMDKEELDRYELLSQTWQSPIIVSTLVQLLDILFSDSTAAIRRMKSLCNSIVVIDEVQTVPYKMLYMFNLAMNFLAYYCNCTIILSSATQPCFEALDYHIAFGENCDMVKYDKDIFSVFKRTEIVDKTAQPMTMDELADFSNEILDESSSLLVICNMKKTATGLFKQLKLLSGGRYKIYHLSTAMCMQHRLDTLKEINDCLAGRKKVICISTQLVEAGVDFSFESCIRVKAGIDNITQAAGRCNRSYDYGKLCNVYVVALKNEGLGRLADIIKTQQAFDALRYEFNLHPEKYDNDLLSDKSISRYYNQLLKSEYKCDDFKYNAALGKSHSEKLFRLLAENPEHVCEDHQYILKQSFKSAGQLFKVFDDDTKSIIVPYNETAVKLIADLCSQKSKFDLKYLNTKINEAKPFTISVYSQRYRQLSEQRQIFSPDDNGRLSVLLDSYYSEETGLVDNNDLFC